MNDTHPAIRYTVMIILGIILGLAFGYNMDAKTTNNIKEKEWVEVNTAVIPEGLEIFSGITKNGYPKYWFEIQGIKVYISPINKEHYQNNTGKILLVEWYNKSTDRYRYTTRLQQKQKRIKL